MVPVRPFRAVRGDVHEAVLLAKQLPNRNPDQPLRFIDFAAPILDEQGQLRGCWVPMPTGPG